MVTYDDLDEILIFSEPSEVWYPAGANWLGGPPLQAYGGFHHSTQNNGWHSSSGKQYRGKSDVGSEWTLLKMDVRNHPNNQISFTNNFSGSFKRGYKGPVGVWDGGMTLSFEELFNAFSSQFSDEMHLASLGTTAISRVLPTNPVSDLPLAVAELLREGLPRSIGAELWTSRAVSPSTVSREYLNFSFGIQPFIRDLLEFKSAVTRAQALIAEYEARSNRILRRRYHFDPVYETVEFVHPPRPSSKGFLAGPCDTWPIGFLEPYGGSNGIRRDVITREKHVWFSGAFQYHLKVPNDLMTKLQREEQEMRYLFGGLSASTAWNLLPYSWAAGWFTNAGDVINNLDAFARDGLVMPWGYVMETNNLSQVSTVEGVQYGTHSGAINLGTASSLPNVFETSFDLRYKRRRQASPFGFGLSDDALTLRQKSIIAALGLSRRAT